MHANSTFIDTAQVLNDFEFMITGGKTADTIEQPTVAVLPEATGQSWTSTQASLGESRTNQVPLPHDVEPDTPGAPIYELPGHK
jgi:hypothetical protein